MKKKDLQELKRLHSQAVTFLETSIKEETKKPRFYKDKLTYRDLSLITGLDVKQLKIISNGIGEVKIKSLITACNGLLQKEVKHGN